jgi:hypothetical protein
MTRPTLTQIVLVLNGVLLTFAGVSLLFAPQWFFDTFAPFAPFNRHFLGDAGAFSLPWGLACFFIARNPQQQRALWGFTVLASSIHALNHLFGDFFIERLPLTQIFTDNLPVWLFALPLALVFAFTFRNTKTDLTGL